MNSSANGAVFVILIVVVIIAFGGNIIQSYLVRQQRAVFIPAEPGPALKFRKAQFARVAWAEGSGPGQVNMRRRHISPRGQYVFSVAVEAAPGGSSVQLWLSNASTTLGGLMVVNGPSAWLQMALIQRRLEQFSLKRGFAPDGSPATPARSSQLSQSTLDSPTGAPPGSAQHTEEMIRRANPYGRNYKIPD